MFAALTAMHSPPPVIRTVWSSSSPVGMACAPRRQHPDSRYTSLGVLHERWCGGDLGWEGGRAH